MIIQIRIFLFLFITKSVIVFVNSTVLLENESCFIYILDINYFAKVFSRLFIIMYNLYLFIYLCIIIIYYKFYFYTVHVLRANILQFLYNYIKLLLYIETENGLTPKNLLFIPFLRKLFIPYDLKQTA